MKKKKILVLMGGRSPEHEISLISGMQVVANLDRKKYEVLPAIISKDGKRLQIVSSTKLLSSGNPIELRGTKNDLIKNPDRELSGINDVDAKFDLVFIAMHGPFGEDGTVQGMLDFAGVKYTGSGVLASALGMDKIAFRKFLRGDDIKIPKYVVMTKNDPISYIVKRLGRPPYFVKPSNQGSSVGNSIAKSKEELQKAFKLAYKFSDRILVDEYIKGIEVTVGVLGNENPNPLPVIEIVPLKNDFFDYESKYTESGAEEIVPARISNIVAAKVQSIAVMVHKLLGCRGFSRVDFILKNGTIPYVLEINTIPGLTPMSLLPKAAKAVGITYPELLDTIVKYAE